MTRLAYFEWSADEDAEHDDPEAWAQANPALGIRIDPDFIRTEMGALEAEDFARERLGIFPEDIDATETVIDEEDWKACSLGPVEVHPSSFASGLVLSFEVSPDRKRSVIAAVGPDGVNTKMGIVENRANTGWVVERLIGMRDKHKPYAIACNPSGAAGGLLPDCERAGLAVTEIKGPDYTQACQAAYDAIKEHRWRHHDQASLTAAATGAGKRVTGDAWVFDRRGVLDISPLIAVVLGAWAVGKDPGPSVYESERGLLVL